LPVGSYTLELLPGWSLERESSGSFAAVQAALVSANPAPFTIADQQTTPVAFAFQTNGEVISLGNGNLHVTIAVNDATPESTAAACADGVDNDADGLIDCADPDCSFTCATPAENTAAACADGVDNDADGLIDCADPDCSFTCAPPTPTLLITEIFYDPNSRPDAVGEWFEVENVGADTAFLDGCRIDSTNDVGFDLIPGVTIAPGAFWVAGLNGDPVTNGGVAVNYQYSGLALSNTTDSLSIHCNGVLVDQVTYGTANFFVDPVGASIQLNTAVINPADNDIGSNWCAATAEFTPGDLGTPGLANTPCP
jgi:hypothetical protein